MKNTGVGEKTDPRIYQEEQKGKKVKEKKKTKA